MLIKFSNLVDKSIFSYDIMVNNKKVGKLGKKDKEISLESEAASNGKVAIYLSIFWIPISNIKNIYLPGPLHLRVKRNIPYILTAVIILVAVIFFYDINPDKITKWIRLVLIIPPCFLLLFSRKLELIESNNSIER
jgi:hypothetical protein